MKKLLSVCLTTIFLSAGSAFANTAPQATSVSPYKGSVPYSNATYPPANCYLTFTARYSDLDGWQDIQQVYILFNTSATPYHAVYAMYDRPTNKLYLRDWYNIAWVGGNRPGPEPDGGAQWYDSTGCTFYRLRTTVSGSGNDLTVNWVFRFKSPMSGTRIKNIYLVAVDSVGNTTGYIVKGNVVIGTNSVPAVGALTPSSGNSIPDQAVTFSATYTDNNGEPDMVDTAILVNSSLSGANAFCGYYNYFTNKLYLASDDGASWLGGFAPGSANIIENSYSRLNCANTTVTGSYPNLTIAWNASFKPAFASTQSKNIYLKVIDGSGATSDWVQKGTWTVYAMPGDYNLNLTGVPWYQNTAPYNSTGAAAAQMILNYVRQGSGSVALTQDEVYQYARSPEILGPELTADEVDKALGHFDPYDASVSNWADSYDGEAGGNPYQGYNFSVDTYDPATDPDAINNYMRDICHWMAYTVTKEDWWLDGELVAYPNTPAAVPLYGTYGHWAVIKGFSASTNPCPEPRTNPWNSPDFTVFGLWIKDPLATGIGQDTYKTAAECISTYLMPVCTEDGYNGKYLQVAEPPLEVSRASVRIQSPKQDKANLVFVNAALPAKSAKDIPVKKKTDWRDILPAQLLSDRDCKTAFTGTKNAPALFVKRLDMKGADYYLVPFNKTSKNPSGFSSAAVIIDAATGHFKETSWTNKPELLIKVGKDEATKILVNYFMRNRKGIPNKELTELLKTVKHAPADLVWSPKIYLPSSPYQPFWRFAVNGRMWYVTQQGAVVTK